MKSNIPQLRFPEFADCGEWEEKALGSLCSMQSGKFISASSISANETENSYPCYGGNGLRGYVKEYSHDGEFSLIGRQGALCGNITFARGKFYATEHALVATPYDDVDNNYLYYVLNLLNLNQYATGQAQPGLSVVNLEKVKSTVSSDKNEQQKIADCLSSLDTLINVQSEKVEKLKSHKKGLLQKLFPQEGQNLPEFRFPEFKDCDKWEEKNLGSLCSMQAGKFISASSIFESETENLYPCYGGNGLRGYVKEYSHDGEFSLIGRQGALCGNITFASGKFYATEHALVATPYQNVVNNFLYYLFRLLNLNQYATGQAQPGLSVVNLERVKSIVSSYIDEQQKIADCFSSLDELIDKHSQKLELLKAHKKGLMQGIFPCE